MAVVDEKEKKQEEKEKKALEKAKAKILDEDDETFCGRGSAQLLDEDAISKSTKGSGADVPIHITQSGDKVTITAEYPTNNLFYVDMPNKEDLYLFTRFYYGDDKNGLKSLIGSCVPRKCSDITKELEKNEETDLKNTATMQFQCTALKNSGSRLQTAKITVESKRFTTKVQKVELEMTKADWIEWKQYRLKAWMQGKVWSADGKPAAEEKEDDKKDKKSSD